ncbi:hypothetical protein Poly41_25330 [Novipirellula artificiosorum]|uniref:Uncharacterized protein n=1 Tax=Novipirellula artificiosorum TaxID=2528016 RepID=A0A5C6DUS3_9BACT|nr:hypothetical protein Poly41_25330 [Novipirellula artificiosorum]
MSQKLLPPCCNDCRLTLRTRCTPPRVSLPLRAERSKARNSKPTMQTLTRKTLAFAAVFSIFPCVSHSSAAAEDASEKVNFLIFVADDLNKEYYGCYGNEKSASPTVSPCIRMNLPVTLRCTPTRRCHWISSRSISPTKTKTTSGLSVSWPPATILTSCSTLTIGSRRSID